MGAIGDETAQVIEQIRQTNSEGTGDRYASCVQKFAVWCGGAGVDPFAATAIEIEAFLRELHEEEDYAYSTLNVYDSALKHFYEEARRLADAGKRVPDPREESPADRWTNPVENALLSNVVTDKEKRQKTKKERALERHGGRHALPPEEVAALIEAVPAPRTRNMAIARLAYEAMLRRGEVAQLKVGDVDFEDRTIYVRAGVAKNGESRTTVYTTTETDHLLRTWLDVDRPAYRTAAESDYLFLSDERGRLSNFHVGDIIRQAAWNADEVDQCVLYETATGNEALKVSTHTLRHSGAVRRWENGADLRTLQKALGHADISTTETYLDVDEEAVTEKLQASWR